MDYLSQSDIFAVGFDGFSGRNNRSHVACCFTKQATLMDVGVQVTLPEGTMPDQFRSDIILLLPRLRRFAFSLTRSGPDADDLLQEACISAIGKWQQYDVSQPFDRWLFRIMRNSWISEIRKRKVRLGEGHVPAEEASELTTTPTADISLEMKDVMGKVANLPEELSQPLMLVCAEGYSYQETAEMLDIPKGTVMSRIHRARQMLVLQLKDDLIDERGDI